MDTPSRIWSKVIELVFAVGAIASTLLVFFLSVAAAATVGSFLESHSFIVILLLVASPFLVAYAWFTFLSGQSRRTSHGSAHFAESRQSASASTPNGLTLGTAHRRPFKTHQHVLVSAPTGSGKGVGLIIPNILTYPGSMVVLDIKGENYHVTSRRRRELGHAVHVLDPFCITGRTDAFNWLTFLNTESDDIVGDAAMLAEMLVVQEESSDPYWNDAARDLLRGLIAHVASGKHPGERNIAEVRRILTMLPSDFLDVLKAMSSSQSAHGLVARSANSFIAKAEKDRSGVLSAATRHTSFLDDPRIVRSVSGGTLDFRAFKTQPCTLYIVMPPDRLPVYRAYVRALFGIALSAMSREPTVPKAPVVFLLDEFPQLGYLAMFENAISLMRGYGVQFVTVIQDLSQLKAVYKKWQTFIANSTSVFFGTTDFDTAQYLSNTLGNETISVESKSINRGLDLDNGGSISTSEIARALRTPDEIRTMPADVSIVLTRGVSPIIVRRTPYFKDQNLRGFYDANPLHPDS